MKKAKKFINKHSVPAQDAEHYFGHNEKVVDITTAKEAIKMAYEAGYKQGIFDTLKKNIEKKFKPQEL